MSFPFPNVWLYKCFNSQGVCLYVGITGDLRERRHAHKYSAAWYGQAATVQLRYIGDPSKAFRAEKQAIKQLCPLYNKIGRLWYKDGWQEAKERQAIKRQRYWRGVGQ